MYYILTEKYSITEYMFPDGDSAIRPLLVPIQRNISLINRIKKKIGAMVFRNCPFNTKIHNVLKKITSNDTLIIIGRHDKWVLYINRNYSNIKRAVVYFWDSCSSLFKEENEETVKATITNLKKFHMQNGFSLYTFDKGDADKYNIKYNPQFFRKFNIGISFEARQTFYFCGVEKGRSDAINLFKNKLSPLGNLYFHVIPKATPDTIIPYTDNLKNDLQSEVLCDIVQKGQTGCTLRIMEGVFLSKKIITNNGNVISLPFYDASRFFILNNESRESDIVSFLNMPYKPLSERELAEYEVHGWVKRF